MEHAEQVPNVEEFVFHGMSELEPPQTCGTEAAETFRDGCLYRMDWTAMAVDGSEYLLVCPCGREKGTAPADGVVVLCVTSLRYAGGDS